ncbi:hypothetical protein V6N13_132237 [Hibiscus sabdariffa]
MPVQGREVERSVGENILEEGEVDKCASMIELQDKAITAKEKKKRRDRAIKRSKRTGKEMAILEVDGSSPTNSDIARKQILTWAARKVMALGKHLGVEFIGDEDEIL